MWIYGENKILWKYNTRVLYCGHTNGERKIVNKNMKKETIEKSEIFGTLKSQYLEKTKL